MDDYQTDARGDVGSWVRVAAMNALSRSIVALARAGAPPCAAVLLVAARALAHQSAERIDRLRRCALECLLTLASTPGLTLPHAVWVRKAAFDSMTQHAVARGCPVDAHALHSAFGACMARASAATLSLSHVDYALFLEDPEDRPNPADGDADADADIDAQQDSSSSHVSAAAAVDWMDPSVSFLLSGLLLCSPLLRYAAMRGVAASGGGLTESTARAAIEGVWAAADAADGMLADGTEEVEEGGDAELLLAHYLDEAEARAHVRVTAVTSAGAACAPVDADAPGAVAALLGASHGLCPDAGEAGITTEALRRSLRAAAARVMGLPPSGAPAGLIVAAAAEGRALVVEKALPATVRAPACYYRVMAEAPDAYCRALLESSGALAGDASAETEAEAEADAGAEAAPAYGLTFAAEVFWDLVYQQQVHRGDARVVPAVYLLWTQLCARGLAVRCGPEEWASLVAAGVARARAEAARTQQVSRLHAAAGVLGAMLTGALAMCAPVLGDQAWAPESDEILDSGDSPPAAAEPHPGALALGLLLALMAHRFPTVRRAAAQALLQSLLAASAAEVGVDEAALAAAKLALTSTAWDTDAEVTGADPRDAVVVARAAVCTALGMELPEDAFAYGQDKGGGKGRDTATGTYAELVKEMY
jgi:hypothetical protein